MMFHIRIISWVILTVCSLILFSGCVPARPILSPTIPPKPVSAYTESYLQQGKRYFEQGYYKKAMHQLLPLACDGNAEAQYAVGYMYYYGYGVAQDTDVGYFWIDRSAKQNFVPAHRALDLIERQKCKPIKKTKLRGEG